MPVTKVRTRWAGGVLQFLDLSGNILFTLDGTAKAINFDKGKLDVSGGSTEISLGALQVGAIMMRANAVGSSVVADESLDAQHVANLADNATRPSLLLLMNIAANKVTTATASGSTKVTSVTLAEKIRVHDVIVILKATGTAGDKLTVQSTAGDITDTMGPTGANQSIVRAAAIDDSKNTIAAGEKLQVAVNQGATSQATATYDVLIVASKSA